MSSEVCSSCRGSSDLLFGLFCDHEVCVSCAAANFPMNGGSLSFVCPVCSQNTQLESHQVSTIEAFILSNSIIPETSEEASPKPGEHFRETGRKIQEVQRTFEEAAKRVEEMLHLLQNSRSVLKRTGMLLEFLGKESGIDMADGNIQSLQEILNSLLEATETGHNFKKPTQQLLEWTSKLEKEEMKFKRTSSDLILEETGFNPQKTMGENIHFKGFVHENGEPRNENGRRQFRREGYSNENQIKTENGSFKGTSRTLESVFLEAKERIMIQRDKETQRNMQRETPYEEFRTKGSLLVPKEREAQECRKGLREGKNDEGLSDPLYKPHPEITKSIWNEISGVWAQETQPKYSRYSSNFIQSRLQSTQCGSSKNSSPMRPSSSSSSGFFRTQRAMLSPKLMGASGNYDSPSFFKEKRSLEAHGVSHEVVFPKSPEKQLDSKRDSFERGSAWKRLRIQQETFESASKTSPLKQRKFNH